MPASHIYDFNQPKDQPLASVSFYNSILHYSNSISNKLALTVMLKQYISDDIKNTSLKNLNDIDNLLSLDFKSGVSFSYTPEKMFRVNGLGMFISVNQREYARVNYTRDAYILTLYGNKSFAGKTANMDGTHFYSIVYQDCKAGLTKQIGKNINVYGGIELVKGHKYYDFNFEKLSVFTEETGEYINLRIKGQVRTTDTITQKLSAINGTGYAAVMGGNWQNKKKTIGITIELNDIGAVNWKRKMHTIPVDTGFTFDGIELDIFNTSVSNPLNIKDSLNNLIWEKASDEAFSEMLPATGYAAITTVVSPKILFNIGLNYYFGAKLPPLFFINPELRLSDRFVTEICLSFGYVENFNAGAGLKYYGKKGMSAYLEIANVPALAALKKSYTQAIYLGCVYKIGNRSKSNSYNSYR